MYSLLESDVRGIRNAGEGRQLPKRWDLRKHSKDLRSWLCRNLCKKKCFQEVNFDLHFILTKGKWWHMAQFSRSVVSDSLWPHGLQHTRPSCPSPIPGVHSNSCPSSRWCHPAMSSSVIPFSFFLQSLPASGSFPVSQLFAWGGQTIAVSPLASVLPMNTQDWSPFGWTGWISLQSKGLSRVFSNTTVQRHQVTVQYYVQNELKIQMIIKTTEGLSV